ARSSRRHGEERAAHQRLAERIADEDDENGTQADDGAKRHRCGESESGEEPERWNEMHGMRSKEMCDAQVATVARPAHDRGAWRICRTAAEEMPTMAGHVPRHSQRQNEREHQAESNGKPECGVEAADPVAQNEDAINQSGGGKQDGERT